MRALLALTLFLAANANAVDVARFERGSTRADASGIPYRAIVTPGRCDGERLPLIVFLHGSGQVGNDNEDQLDGQANGALELVDAALHGGVPLVFAAPQVNTQDWSPAQVFEVVAALVRRYPVDPKRITLTGLSSGGTAVWDAVKSAPSCFAAAVPMSGMTDIAGLAAIAHVPVWAFHGDQDSTDDIDRGEGGAMVGSRALVRALQRAGGHPRFTEYPDLGHVIWRRAYADPGLLPWILDQRIASRRCDFD